MSYAFMKCLCGNHWTTRATVHAATRYMPAEVTIYDESCLECGLEGVRAPEDFDASHYEAAYDAGVMCAGCDALLKTQACRCAEINARYEALTPMEISR